GQGQKNCLCLPPPPPRPPIQNPGRPRGPARPLPPPLPAGAPPPSSPPVRPLPPHRRERPAGPGRPPPRPEHPHGPRCGPVEGLLDPKLLAGKKAAEDKLRAAVAAKPDLKDAAGAWDRIAAAQKVIGENARNYNMLEAGRGFNSTLFEIARTLLRAAEEKPK